MMRNFVVPESHFRMMWGGGTSLSKPALPRAGAMQSKRTKFPATVLIVGLMLSAGCGKMGLPPAGPPDVEVVEVLQQDVPITKNWVATLDGLVNAQVRAQVSGVLLRQNYANGAFVKKGAP